MFIESLIEDTNKSASESGIKSRIVHLAEDLYTESGIVECTNPGSTIVSYNTVFLVKKKFPYLEKYINIALTSNFNQYADMFQCEEGFILALTSPDDCSLERVKEMTEQLVNSIPKFKETIEKFKKNNESNLN
jgi:hypothetical protein